MSRSQAKWLQFIDTLTRAAAWYASKGKEQQAKKALRLVYRDVPDLDVDAQYEILVAGIEHEREFAIEQKREKWYSIFRGVDGVSGRGVVLGPVQNTEKADWAVPNDRQHLGAVQPAAAWSYPGKSAFHPHGRPHLLRRQSHHGAAYIQSAPIL